MSFMENDRQSINVLIRLINKPFNIMEKRSLWKKYTQYGNYIFEQYYKDDVNEKDMLVLLRKSIFSNRIKQYLIDIVFQIHPDTVNDRVLSYCVYYPGKFRRTLLVQLAHLWLPVHQLQIINQHIDTPEAFLKLCVLFSKNQFCSLEMFQEFLLENLRFLSVVDCQQLTNICGMDNTNPKFAMLKQYTDLFVDK